MTERNKTRALNAFAAMSRISDEYVLAAEQMLYEAEAGIAYPAKPEGRFRRFLNSGWSAAVISGLIALAVLVFIIRAGKEPPTSPPPAPPADSTIEMSDEGVNYSLIMEQSNYPEGADSITVAMVGKDKGEPISTPGGWHLEKLTAEGAEAVPISYTEEFTEAAPKKDEYAFLTKAIRIEGSPLTAGTYRLHATEYDGEKYVSVAWCEFTVEDAETRTQEPESGHTETEVHPVTEFPAAEDKLFAINEITVTPSPFGGRIDVAALILATKPNEVLEIPDHTVFVVKLKGTPNPSEATWSLSSTGIGTRDPANGVWVGDDAYAAFDVRISLHTPEAWLPGVYRLYILNTDEEAIDYADFSLGVYQPPETAVPSTDEYPAVTEPAYE